MTGTALNDKMNWGGSWGHQIPGRMSPLQWRVIAVAAAATLAALLSGADRLGSVLALCFLAPYLAMLFVLPSRVIAGHFTQLVFKALPAVAIAAVAIEPGLLNITMAWLCLGAYGAMRAGADAGNVLHMLRALLLRLLGSPSLLRRDARLVGWLRKRRGLTDRLVTFSTVLLPVVAIMIFAVLLAVANPLIAEALSGFGWGNLFPDTTLRNMLVFVVTTGALWPLLRLKRFAPAVDFTDAHTPRWHRAYFQPVSVALTLLMLNVLFGWQNLLDFQHVWQDGALPPQYTHAEYVHRGSYTLIATVMLAALLMIFALWPQTRTAENKAVRQLVYLWIAQNILLVASSVKRTLAYVDDYGMTEWRLAGLLWMGLVGFGLVSICWHVVQRRSARWLVNVNLAVSFLLLLSCGFWDGRAVVANWNVERAMTRAGTPIDLFYLVGMGPSALPAISRLQRFEFAKHGPHPSIASALDNFLAREGRLLQDDLDKMQSDWRSWTFRYAGLGAQ